MVIIFFLKIHFPKYEKYNITYQVQEAVANCLPPLVPGIKQNAPELVQKLLHLLLESDNYGERRGAAYGLAGLVRGLGITALKQLEIMSTLEQAVKDKKNPRRKEGAVQTSNSNTQIWNMYYLLEGFLYCSVHVLYLQTFSAFMYLNRCLICL